MHHRADHVRGEVALSSYNSYAIGDGETKRTLIGSLL